MSVACDPAGTAGPADHAGGEAAGFASTPAGWRYAGDLTVDNAGAMLDASRALPLPAGGTIDVAGLRHADSSALAVLIAIRRRAAKEGVRVVIAGMPAPLHALAVVYGVEELLA